MPFSIEIKDVFRFADGRAIFAGRIHGHPNLVGRLSYAEQVTVGPAVRGRNRFDPDRVTIEWRQR